MPTTLPLTQVPLADLPKVPGLPKMKQFDTEFPKRTLTTMSDAKKAFRNWQRQQPSVPSPRTTDLAVGAAPLTAARLAQLRAVVDSQAAPAEMLSQKLDANGFFGILYSALTAYEFMKLESERKRRASTGRAARADREWDDVVRAAQQAFAAGGLKDVTAGTLSRYAREVASNKDNLNAVIRVADSGVAIGAPSTLDGRTTAVAAFVPVVEHFLDPAIDATHIADLCDDPIATGSFTKHFARSFSLSVRLRVWCPTWTNPFRTCLKTFTIAAVSFSVGVSVGYRVNCCGATAWGQAYAQVCATILGVSLCAGCSATVTGVVGVSRTPVGTSCTYGLGLNAVLTCTLFGHTIFTASVPFGYAVTGPCPPPALCA
jgi:hypothetical protein